MSVLVLCEVHVSFANIGEKGKRSKGSVYQRNNRINVNTLEAAAVRPQPCAETLWQGCGEILVRIVELKD